MRTDERTAQRGKGGKEKGFFLQKKNMDHHQRRKAVLWRSPMMSSSSSDGITLRSKGRGFRTEVAAAMSPLSITEDDESQSLWQSSGRSGGLRGCRRNVAGGRFAGAGRGPLKDSTVLLMPLDVGLWA